MPSPANRPASPANKADKELLFKGVTCALIGLVVLIAPYVARSPSVQDIMAQSALVGWFPLVLVFTRNSGPVATPFSRKRWVNTPSPLPSWLREIQVVT